MASEDLDMSNKTGHNWMSMGDWRREMGDQNFEK
jgi:hypothetical protein